MFPARWIKQRIQKESGPYDTWEPKEIVPCVIHAWTAVDGFVVAIIQEFGKPEFHKADIFDLIGPIVSAQSPIAKVGVGGALGPMGRSPFGGTH